MSFISLSNLSSLSFLFSKHVYTSSGVGQLVSCHFSTPCGKRWVDRDFKTSCGHDPPTSRDFEQGWQRFRANNMEELVICNFVLSLNLKYGFKWSCMKSTETILLLTISCPSRRAIQKNTQSTSFIYSHFCIDGKNDKYEFPAASNLEYMAFDSWKFIFLQKSTPFPTPFHCSYVLYESST